MKKLLAIPLILLLLALPAYALADGASKDRQYTVEVTLLGGSGRAGVASPAEITVAGGKAAATVIWSSPYYEYMRIDGITYYPVNTDGNSTFEIPVTLDEDMAVTAETVAMSEPHEINYTLYFDSATLKPLDSGASWAGVLVWAVPAALAATGAVVVITQRVKRTKTGQTP